MKFGGSSLGTAERIKIVADRIVEKKQAGHQCVIVVSAMGDTTDDLLDLSKQLTDRAPEREMDMLLTTGEQVSMSLMAIRLNQLGHKAVSYTGWQAGIQTDDQHAKAKIHQMKPDRVKAALDEGQIVIVAGFQ